MAGKSTYLRSAALITIMAQTGSYVPAREAVIGICDRIYCRVGASDNLARGESTFLVEMNETAFIMNTATERSLVIMDEVGRGTGTNDGLSIAWAVSEELLNRIGCRTLFATHFHELSQLSHKRLANRSMEVLEKDGKIIFLRKIKEGPAAESYGIHVAQLAGLSELILNRAWQIMDILRKRDAGLSETFQDENIFKVNVNCEEKQVNIKSDLFSLKKIDRQSGVIEKYIHDVNPEELTPLEALNLICQWKKLISSESFHGKQIKERKIKKKNEGLSLFD
jgi:DNA mismatch repair protein MutS